MADGAINLSFKFTRQPTPQHIRILVLSDAWCLKHPGCICTGLQSGLMQQDTVTGSQSSGPPPRKFHPSQVTPPHPPSKVSMCITCNTTEPQLRCGPFIHHADCHRTSWLPEPRAAAGAASTPLPKPLPSSSWCCSSQL